ncbi:MAG: hypothetical protein J7K51_03265 [Thermotogae bacterium]|nr:hypothetical protein [Thermotogota bacterium]
MPYLGIQTNVEVGDKDSFLKDISALVAKELGKPERYVMVSVENKEMLFGGSGEVCAFVELKSIGLPSSETAGLSRAICDFIKERLKVPPERVYINFADVRGNMWGWNGSTF